MPISIDDHVTDNEIFSRHFWGENAHDGLDVLLDRLSLGETTTKNVLKFISQFEKLEEEYSSGLKRLSTIKIYKDEYPSVKRALNEVIEQVISMSKAHAKFSSELRTTISKRLKECMTMEHNVRKEQKELLQNQIQALGKARKRASKAKEAYFSNCKIKEALLSQKPSPASKSFDLHEDKLQKIMASSQDDEQTYIETVRDARTEHDAWVNMMKTACSECQQAEKDRIEAIANAIKAMSLSLRSCRDADVLSSQVIEQVMNFHDTNVINIKQDFIHFCEKQGTGKVIPEPPSYINYYTMSPMMLPSFSASSSLAQHNFSASSIRDKHTTNSEPQIPKIPESYSDSIELKDDQELFSVRVLYDYKASQKEELDLAKDQIIIVTSLRENPWWIGYEKNYPEKIGLFPSNYVSRITAE